VVGKAREGTAKKGGRQGKLLETDQNTPRQTPKDRPEKQGWESRGNTIWGEKKTATKNPTNAREGHAQKGVQTETFGAEPLKPKTQGATLNKIQIPAAGMTSTANRPGGKEENQQNKQSPQKNPLKIKGFKQRS